VATESGTENGDGLMDVDDVPEKDAVDLASLIEGFPDD
jgi:hypothetical protein